MTYFEALVLGVVEGLTEFLPVSSTAHLMFTAQLLQLDLQNSFLKTFVVAIQPGAILAVLVLYWRKLLLDRAVVLRIAVAFVPTAVLGLLCHALIDELLESVPVALAALAAGGVLLILFERWHREGPRARDDIAELPYATCVWIGVFQSLAFIPGVSRSAATILGGLVLGLRRTAAVEFSFLLAVPTMAAATGLKLYKDAGAFSAADAGTLAVGVATSFVIAILAIRFLLHFVRSYTFIPFGVYRIVAGVGLAVYFYLFAAELPPVL